MEHLTFDHLALFSPQDTLLYDRAYRLNPIDRIYKISESHVAKIVRNFWDDNTDYRARREKGQFPTREQIVVRGLQSLEEECVLTHDAFAAGISVPKPEGVYRVRIPHPWNLEEQKEAPALVMAYVPGILVCTLPGAEEYAKAVEKMNSEIEKACKAGFVPFDHHTGNAIWNDTTRKLTLIDLEVWRKK